MRQIETIRHDQIGSDGQALRKYDILENSTSSKGLNLAVGLLISNVILMIKGIFFSGTEDEKNNALEKSGLAGDELLTGAIADIRPSKLTDINEKKNPPIEQDNVETLNSFGSSFHFTSGDGLSFSDNSGIKSVSSYNYQLRLNTGSHSINEKPDEDTVVPFPGISRMPQSNAFSGGGGHPDTRKKQQNPFANDIEDGIDTDQPGQRNRLPLLAGPVILSDLYINQSIILGQSHFLEGAFDPDDDVLSVQNVRVNIGVLNQNSDGNWKYIPNPYDLSDVIFTYEIFDGSGIVTQVAQLSYAALPGKYFSGTEVSDLIVGTAGGDLIETYGGDDTILAREDNDVVKSGSGNDLIVGGQGNDVIYGGFGDDVIFGGSGNDLLFGEEGNDVLFGEEGDDSLFGNDGADVLFAGMGNDRAFGGAGNDELFGAEGNDYLDGEEGRDFIDGGSGNDVLIGGLDTDTVDGGAGDDVFVALMNDGDDFYDGGEGVDTFNLSSILSDSVINLNEGHAYGIALGDDQIHNFENVIAGEGNDVIVANEFENSLAGNVGDDVFVFINGNKSGSGGHVRDRIEDFEVGDKIDVSLLDGQTELEGLQKLIFKYDQAQFDGVGQVLYFYEDDDTGTNTILRFNFDEDDFDEAEFEIEIIGRHDITEDNLIT